VHLEKLHERAANGHVVFDDEHEARGVFCHLSGQYTAPLYGIFMRFPTQPGP
jgi:hypothetical protein